MAWRAHAMAAAGRAAELGALDAPALDALNEFGDTPLIVACLTGNAECVAVLLRAGADVNRTGAHGWSAVHAACRSEERRADCLRQLVFARASVNQSDDAGRFPLHDACAAADLECVQLLIGAGADPRLRTAEGHDAIYAATHSEHARTPEPLVGDSEIERFLMDAIDAPLLNADVVLSGGAMDGRVGTVLGFDRCSSEYVVVLFHGETVVRVRAERLQRTSLSWKLPLRSRDESVADNERTVAALPTLGGIVHSTIVCRQRHLQCRHARARTVFRRRCRGAPSTTLPHLRFRSSRANEDRARDERERLALHAAVAMGNVVLVRRLLACGAAINAVTSMNCETPLHLAAEVGVLSLVELLLVKDAHVEAQNKDGDRPLHCAAFAGDVDAMRLLVEGRASVDAQGHAGETPLHIAASRGNDASIRYLLDEAEATVNAKDERGCSPLRSALAHGAPTSAVNLLRARGAVSTQHHDTTITTSRATSTTLDSIEPALSKPWRERAESMGAFSRRLLVFNEPASSIPGAAVLAEGIAHLSSDRLEKWRRACCTFMSDLDSAMLQVPAALDSEACAALRTAVESYGTSKQDNVDNLPNVDWHMSVSELQRIIGEPAMRALCSLAGRFHGADPGEPIPARIFARRYSPSAEDQPWTSFHFDAAHTTVNVSLSDESDVVGGQLYCLCDRRITHVSRREGDATVHTSSMLHGVSRVCRGKRYSLIMFFPGLAYKNRKYIFLGGCCAARGFL